MIAKIVFSWSNPNINLIVMLSGVLECYTYFKTAYSTKSVLTSDQFADVFSPIIGNTIEYFKIFEFNGMVEVNDAVSPLFLMSKGLLIDIVAHAH